MNTHLTWRAAMWWLVGYSTTKNGEQVEWVDPDYLDDFNRGRRVAGCQE